jgi:predicted ATPase
MLAEAYGLADQYEQGLSELEAAFSEAETSGTRHWAAELYRRRGELLLCLGESDDEEAVAWLQKALETARQQSARSLELRAALSLARFLCRQQQPAAAYTLLQPIYAGFSEGLDTADLQAAQTLLRSLRG